MAMFSQAEHVMRRAASTMEGAPAAPPRRKCFGCGEHTLYDSDSDHLWAHCPRRHLADVRTAAKANMMEYFTKRDSARREA
eukprot:6187302-Ditylum_brightwellii.AAC.1